MRRGSAMAQRRRRQGGTGRWRREGSAHVAHRCGNERDGTGSWRRGINSWPRAPEMDPKPRLLPVGTAGAATGDNETPRLGGAWGRRHSRAGPGAGLGTASSAP